MKQIIIAFFCFCCISSYAQIENKENYLDRVKENLRKKWPENKAVNLVFHGHSVPAAYFNTPNVRTAEAYPHLVFEALKNVYPYAVINTITTAMGGENAEQGLSRFKKDVLVHRPDVLFIDYALNDRKIGLERAEKAWEKMIYNALQKDCHIILLTPTPDLSENIIDDNSILEKHTQIIRKLAAKHNIGLIDSYAVFKEKAKNGENIKKYMSQSNHPNEKGHALVADLIIAYFMDNSELKNHRSIKIGQIMEKVAGWQLKNFENQVYKGSKWKNSHAYWAWTNATLYLGIAKWAELSGDKLYWDFLYTIGKKNQWKPGPNIFFADDICIIQTYNILYEKYIDKKMIEFSIKSLDEIIKNTQDISLQYESADSHSRWCWCDALFMAPTSFVRVGKVSGDKKYFDFMDKEFWVTYDSLYCPSEKLFFRDTRYKTMREKNGEKVFWGRGNGWVIAALTIIIENLPDNYHSKQRYINLYKEMMQRIAELQDSQGFWHPSLLDIEEYKMPETSASSFFTYGLAWGINKGYLDRNIYTSKTEKAWSALCSVVNEEGKLGFVQAIGADPKKVKPDDSEVYGVGAFLLAGSEIYKLINN
ncbi:MAG: glycoside hydrolase family 88 protein [Prevotellaceae bacterium]|jgi:rhamnogalacturonyl hydrolase YesR/lysophospholipase L1-like esterase|nr:glycoside hydrolase family 88 protein [Prevotellaceae bacterium]